MTDINPLLLLDYYKTTHNEQYPKGITKIVSYYTPRMSRLSDEDELVMFGLQAFIKQYLIESFHDNFFGGNVNTKGFKVLDPHVKVIYGDSITPQRAENIYSILIANGFACNNVLLGVGSFSMQCLECDGGALAPYTRDTFGIAIKATYCEVDGKPIQIFKNPKTDTGHFKKSQRGLCVVYRGADGRLGTRDGYDAATIGSFEGENLLKPVFRDGKMLREQTLQEIRDTLHDGRF